MLVGEYLPKNPGMSYSIGGCNPYFQTLKPSFLMVLGSKGTHIYSYIINSLGLCRYIFPTSNYNHSLDIQSPCQMMIRVYNHLRNERYLGSMLRFSGGDWIPSGYISWICLFESWKNRPKHILRKMVVKHGDESLQTIP